MSDDMILDLDAGRRQRAAEREGKKQPLPIRLGGEVIATLPVELPIDVLAPLRSLDGDLTILLREAMNSARSQKKGDTKARAIDMDTTDLVIDLLATNPRLPMNALDTFANVARNLLGTEGFDALLAARPSGEDYAVLVKGVFSFYGLSLGEASPSSDSSTGDGGKTSSGTSSTNSDSTPEESGTTPTLTPSSEPVGS